MKKPERKTKRVLLGELSNYDIFINNPLEGLEERVRKLISEQAWSNNIEIHDYPIYCDVMYSDVCGCDMICFYIERSETDQEYNKRIAAAEKRRKTIEKRQASIREKKYQEYLKLKKEFEK